MPDHPYSFEPLTKFEPGYETVQDRVHRILSLGEECVEVTELIQLMENPASPLVAYDGFEPSGKMNIAQALFKKHIVNEMQKCGFTFLFWIADFFAMLNLKQGGDMNKIKLLGKYFQEVWIACGMKMDRVVFLWAFDEILTRPKDYLQLVFDIATKSSLARVRKCSTIMGRTEEESQLQSSQILYPIFQCADIFFLGVDVCQLGMDQRKVNMLARDFADSSSQKDQNLSSDVDSKHNVDPPNHTDKKGKRKPIVLSHHMLAGLKKGQAKMSKSDPESCIYMNDSAEMVQAKIQKAYCPTGPKPHSSHFPIYLSCSFCVCVYNCFVGPDAEKDNPCLEYFKYIVFPNLEKKPLVLECTISIFKVGGANNAMEVPDVTDVKLYPTYSHLLKDYLSSAIYPNDLKTSLAKELNKLIEPVREHFRTNVKAAQLLEQVQQQCQ
jgi:tyrosyl-tRNA synthetase